MRQRHRRNRVSMVRHPAAHRGYRRSHHAPSRNGLTRQHPERRLSTTLLLEKQSAVDNNRRYVSRVLGSEGNRSLALLPAFSQARFSKRKLVFRHSSHIGDLCPRRGSFARRGSVHVLEPHQKGEQPHTSFPPAPSARSFVRALVPACSYIPTPVPHPRVFGLPSAHNPRLRFFVQPQRSLRALAFSVRPDPVRRMIPSVRPSARPFTMPQPRFALSQFRLPRVGFLSRFFGSLAPVSRSALPYTLARVPRPLLRRPL